MKSTGESHGCCRQLWRAFYKPTRRRTKAAHARHRFFSVNDQDKPHVAEVAKRFFELGFNCRPHGTADLIEAVAASRSRLQSERRRPNPDRSHQSYRIQLIVTTTARPDPYFDEKAIRRAAVTGRIPTITQSPPPALADGIAALRGEKCAYRRCRRYTRNESQGN